MIHGPASTKHRAAKLRRTMTLPEVLLWRELRRRPQGLKFRRQHPAGDYVLDFFCAQLALAVEIDGFAHDCGEVSAKDAVRDAWLSDNGIKVVRILAVQVLNDLNWAVEAILSQAAEINTSSP